MPLNCAGQLYWQKWLVAENAGHLVDLSPSTLFSLCPSCSSSAVHPRAGSEASAGAWINMDSPCQALMRRSEETSSTTTLTANRSEEEWEERGRLHANKKNCKQMETQDIGEEVKRWLSWYEDACYFYLLPLGPYFFLFCFQGRAKRAERRFIRRKTKLKLYAMDKPFISCFISDCTWKASDKISLNNSFQKP